MLCGASAGWQSLISGSNLNNGVNAGPTNLNANNSESGNRNANIGRQEAALKIITVNTTSTLPLGKTGLFGSCGLVRSPNVRDHKQQWIK